MTGELPEVVEMTAEDEAEYWRTHGSAETPDCDCGHDGLGSAWHDRACVWIVRQ